MNLSSALIVGIIIEMIWSGSVNEWDSLGCTSNGLVWLYTSKYGEFFCLCHVA